VIYYSSVLVSDISFVASSFQFYIYKHIHGCCNKVSQVLANMEGRSSYQLIILMEEIPIAVTAMALDDMKFSTLSKRN
jgi:hypothetical protein